MSDAPKRGVSIILPAYNEEKYIGQVLVCLIKALEHSNIKTEVIVVDNGSTDSTQQIIESFPVQLVKCDKKGAAACRNLGATYAVFDKLAFLDSDCIVDDSWIENIVFNLDVKGNAAYGGPCVAPKNGSWIEKAWAPVAIITNSYEVSLLAGCNFAVHKKIFNELGGFKEYLLTAEDDDLSKRINKSTSKCIRDTKQAVVHLGYPKTLIESFKKVLWHGSTQLQAHGLFSDKMVMLTILWASCLLLSFLALDNQILFTFLTIITFFVLPSLLVVKKLSYRNKTLYETMIIYILTLVTLIARSAGLIIEVYKLVNNRINQRKKEG